MEEGEEGEEREEEGEECWSDGSRSPDYAAGYGLDTPAPEVREHVMVT